ncbi:MAG: SDR family NAD(P)-dependent oxidoreductase [Ruminococcus sp.]|nr:SDR family NAD(P)-dependent oxidoreductase [Ruminococcus sp.]
MKTIIITGSTKGIGKAIGIKFLKNHYYVIFNYATDDEGGKILKEEISEYEGQFEIIKNDFLSEEKIDEFAEQVTRDGRIIDMLVLNAGITDRTPWEKMNMRQWNEVLKVNLTVPAFLIQKIGRHICKGGVYLMYRFDFRGICAFYLNSLWSI